MILFRLFLVLFFGLLLSACAALSGIGSSNAPTPAALVDFQPQFIMQTAWSKNIGASGEKDYLKLGPVVDNKIFSASAAGEVTANNAQTGSKYWQTNTKTAITSGPVATDNLVVVGTADAQVIALNATTGAQVWRSKIPNAVLAAPQISDGRVLVRTVDGKLCALSAETGQLLWTYDHGSPVLILRVNSTPQITEDSVIAGFADGKVAAYTLAQGKLLWEQTIAAPQGMGQARQMVDVAADPIVADGVVYVATYQGKIAALSLATGGVLWQTDISTYTGLVLGPRLLYVTDAEGTVWAFDRYSGNVVWRQTQLANRVLTAPALMDDAVVVADAEGYVHCLSLVDGHLLSRILIDKKKSIIAPPVVLNNIVYVATTDGNLFALRRV
jgi:outer membrane protein assembly factor BamB